MSKRTSKLIKVNKYGAFLNKSEKIKYFTSEKYKEEKLLAQDIAKESMQFSDLPTEDKEIMEQLGIRDIKTYEDIKKANEHETLEESARKLSTMQPLGYLFCLNLMNKYKEIKGNN